MRTQAVEKKIPFRFTVLYDSTLFIGYITLSVLHTPRYRGASILIYPISTISYALTEITALFTDYVPDRARPPHRNPAL